MWLTERLNAIDTTMNLMGYPIPPDVPYPRPNPADPLSQRIKVFAEWCSAYYIHPHFNSPNLHPEKHVKNLMHLPLTGPEKPKPATVETMSQEEKDACIDAQAGDTEAKTLGLNPKTLYDLTIGTFLADHEHPNRDERGPDADKSAQTFLPDLQISYVYCQESLWSSTLAWWDLEEDIQKWKEEKRVLRPMAVRAIPGANHFVSCFP